MGAEPRHARSGRECEGKERAGDLGDLARQREYAGADYHVGVHRNGPERDAVGLILFRRQENAPPFPLGGARQRQGILPLGFTLPTEPQLSAYACDSQWFVKRGLAITRRRHVTGRPRVLFRSQRTVLSG